MGNIFDAHVLFVCLWDRRRKTVAVQFASVAATTFLRIPCTNIVPFMDNLVVLALSSSVAYNLWKHTECHKTTSCPKIMLCIVSNGTRWSMQSKHHVERLWIGCRNDYLDYLDHQYSVTYVNFIAQIIFQFSCPSNIHAFLIKRLCYCRVDVAIFAACQWNILVLIENFSAP